MANKVSMKWRDFGKALNMTYNELCVLKEQYHGYANNAWDAVMDRWLRGNSSYSVTWEGLYSLLNDMEFSQVAVELKAAVALAIPSTIAL